MNNGEPEISIIVPVFNAEQTLSRCVKSIISQTFPYWELLLIDDGSADNSLSECNNAALNDKRIRVLSQNHRGVSVARNLALENVLGKYICFVDADDVIEPDYLEKLYRFHDYDMVICGYFVDQYNSDHQLLHQKKYIPYPVDYSPLTNKEALMPLFMAGMININCNKLLHTSIIKEHTLRYMTVPVNEDYLFMVDYLINSHSIRTIEQPLYHWIHVDGKKTGVDALPDNILDIYNLAQIKTRSFFGNDALGDVTQYYSYCIIINKYFSAYQQKYFTRKVLKERLRLFHNNIYVRAAFSAYNPKTKGEWFMHSLLKNGFYHLYYFINTHYDFLKRIIRL